MAQTNNQGHGSIKGSVKDSTGSPLTGVNVALLKLNKGASTNADGNFTIKDVPPGTYKLRFSFIGFAKINKEVLVSSGKITTADVFLRQKSASLDAFTVTGTAYATEALNAPADIDVISDIKKFQVSETSLGSTLENLAGVSTISTGPQMGKPVIHGLHGSRIRVLDNGTPSDYQQFGVRHGPNVDPFVARRIEVVKGAASVQYGSDAIGGAVNILSRPIPSAVGEPSYFGGTALGVYATNNEEASGGLHLHGASGRLGFTGTIVRKSGGDITVPNTPTFNETNDPTAPKFAGKLSNTDFDQLNGSLGLGYQLHIGQISARYKRWSNEQNLLLPNGKGLGQNLENNSLQVKADLDIGNNFILKPRFSYNNNLRQSNQGGDNAEPRSELPENGRAFLDLVVDSYTSRLELEHPNVGPFRGTIGVEYMSQDQHSRGNGELIPSASITNFGTFIFEQGTFNDFTLSAGLRFDTRSQEAKPSAKLNLPDYSAGETKDVLKQDYSAFSGSVGATYQLTNALVVAANVGHGFRAPSIFNLHASGFHGGVAAFQKGNPYLDPEHSTNTSLSLRWKSSLVNAEITGYRNYIQNYILLANTGNFTNGGSGAPILKGKQGSARLLGIDANIEAQILPWLQVHSTFELVDGENVDKSLSSVDKLPLLPANTLKGGAKFMQGSLGKLENAYISVTAKHAFQKDAAGRYEPFWQFGNAPQFSAFGVASTDAYTILNASLGFELPLWNRPVAFNISAKNLLDTVYRDFLDTYKGYALSPGRGITAKVKIPFGQ